MMKVTGVPAEQAPYWFEYFDEDEQAWVKVTGWYMGPNGVMVEAPPGATIRMCDDRRS